MHERAKRKCSDVGTLSPIMRFWSNICPSDDIYLLNTYTLEVFCKILKINLFTSSFCKVIYWIWIIFVSADVYRTFLYTTLLPQNIPDKNKTVKNRTVILIMNNIISCLYSLKLNKLFQPAGSTLLLFQILAPTYRALQH